METSKFGEWGRDSEASFKSQFPLHAACRDGDTAELDRLLKDGSHNIYEEDGFYGWTPAHFAAYFGTLACLRKMATCTRLAINLDVKISKFSQTPTHLAAFGGHPHCLHWLLNSGSNLEEKDYLGETALHKAARAGTAECCSLLLAHGATPDLPNSWEQTPADLACRLGHVEVAKALHSAIYPTQKSVEPVPEHSVRCVMNHGLNGGMLPPAGQAQDDVDMEVVQPVTEVGLSESESKQVNNDRKRPGFSDHGPTDEKRIRTTMDFQDMETSQNKPSRFTAACLGWPESDITL